MSAPHAPTHWKVHQHCEPSLLQTHTACIALQPIGGIGGIGGMPHTWATMMPARMNAFIANASLALRSLERPVYRRHDGPRVTQGERSQEQSFRP
jgi:hypothetical protein